MVGSLKSVDLYTVIQADLTAGFGPTNLQAEFLFTLLPDHSKLHSVQEVKTKKKDFQGFSQVFNIFMNCKAIKICKRDIPVFKKQRFQREVSLNQAKKKERHEKCRIKNSVILLPS